MGDYTIRDEKGVIKTMAGMFKLLMPHGEYDGSELEIIASMAAKARQRITNELSQLSPTEFPRKTLGIVVRG